MNNEYQQLLQETIETIELVYSYGFWTGLCIGFSLFLILHLLYTFYRLYRTNKEFKCNRNLTFK